VAASSPASSRTLELRFDVAPTTSTTSTPVAEVAPVPKGKLRKTKAPRSQKAPAGPMPADWAPSPAHLAKGLDLGFDAARVQVEAVRFTDHHQSKGNVFADWDAAFRGWLGNEVRYEAERRARASSMSGGSRNTLQPAAPAGAPTWKIGREM
jgi:hypothetical protein